MQFEGQLAQAQCQHPFAVLGPQFNGTNTFVQYWQPGRRRLRWSTQYRLNHSGH